MEVVIRATVIYFFLWIVARGVGKRELSQMSAFELILMMIMGDLVQQGVTQEDMSLTGAMLAVGTIAFWIVVFSYASWRFRSTRSLLEGLPVIVVRDGEPIEQALRMERMPLDELLEAARDQGIADLSEVRIAVLEPDGKVSFITRDGQQQPDDSKTIS